MRRLGAAMALAAAGIGVSGLASPNLLNNRTFDRGKRGWRPPHTNEREIARRARQAAQIELNRANRLLRSLGKAPINFGAKTPKHGLTRRGRKVPL